MKRYYLLLTLCIQLLAVAAQRQNGIRTITMDHGLPSNTVRNIVQDPRGFLWMGTDNGLCRYDGIRASVYHINENGTDQYISALHACDEGLYVGTAHGVFFLRYDTDKLERLPMDIHTPVTSFAQDADGTLWLSTGEQGVWSWQPSQRTSAQHAFSETRGAVAQVVTDADNRLWAVCNDRENALWQFNRIAGAFEPVRLSYEKDYNSMAMIQTHDGRLWLGTWEHGLLLMHDDGTLEQIAPPDPAHTCHHIHRLFEHSPDCLLIGCDDGLFSLNPLTRQWQRLADNNGMPMADRFVYCMENDREGAIWYGTFYGGVGYISPVGHRFQSLTCDGTAGSLPGRVISRFCEDGLGNVWIASDDGGLIRYGMKERALTAYPHQDILGKCNAHALCLDGDDLWVGTYSNGIFVLNLQNGALRHYQSTSGPVPSKGLGDNSSYAIFRDSHGEIWVGTMSAIVRYHRDSDSFRHIQDMPSLVIDIDEDSLGRLWFCTQGDGIWRLEPQQGQWKQYRQPHLLPDNEVNCISIGPSGALWAGTRSCLCLYDEQHDRFSPTALETPSSPVFSIIEDQGALWLSTDKGIVKYVPGQDARIFTRHDGLGGEQAQPNAALKASDGSIFFGMTNGVNIFYPYQIKVNNTQPPVYITGMDVLGHPLDIMGKETIDIGYGDRMITLTFASLSYCSPEKNQYAYMLEGFDRDWHYAGNQHQATYTNLPSGSYVFRVKGTNNDGVWSETEARLRIEVQPPFWWSWYAKLLYLLLLIATGWLILQSRMKKVEHLHREEMRRLTETKEEEVREARLRFFTMIAHEIRTPVSLIIGPLEKIMKQGNPSDDMKVIDRNAHRLLELVNQLLDFRKVEEKEMTMHFAPQPIRQLIQNVCERFEPTFAQGNKRFTVDYPDEHFTAIVDSEAITKVISNLLTNANKYTRDQVSLRCFVEPDETSFRVEVADNGMGIKEEDRERIFKPFYQAADNKPGTGIGLSIVRDIVSSHHGTITLQSEVGKGSTFTVILPVSQQIQPSESVAAVTPLKTGEPEQAKEGAASSATMLIVDDNEDMVGFLSSHFAARYHVITAADGIEALEKMSSAGNVQLVISDWMMPRMDGAELCRRVRMNPDTSHIAFVMLTAKTDDDSKIEGMDVGADAYIEKPFSIQYLEGCIKNMFDMRQRLRERFSSDPFESVTEIASNPTDNELLKRMNRIIEENFANPDLSVNYLAEQLAVSRSGLFAKLKSLADMTPNEMIQMVRLKRAAALLAEGKYQVSEVCYMVGFNTPSYFTKCFQKQFGIKPGEVKARTQESSNMRE